MKICWCKYDLTIKIGLVFMSNLSCPNYSKSNHGWYLCFLEIILCCFKNAWQQKVYYLLDLNIVHKSMNNNYGSKFPSLQLFFGETALWNETLNLPTKMMIALQTWETQLHRGLKWLLAISCFDVHCFQYPPPSL